MTPDEHRDLIHIYRALSSPIEPLDPGYPPRLTRGVVAVKAVLFDVYGTLFVSSSGDVGTADDGEGARRDAFAAACVAAGVSLEDETYERAVGVFLEEIRAHHIRARSSGTAFPEVDIVAIWQGVLSRLDPGQPPADAAGRLRRLAVEFECRTNPCWPMPRSRPTIELVAAAVPTGIVSNAQFYTPLMWEALLGGSPAELGIRDDLIIWSYQRGVAKPDESLFRDMTVRLAKEGIEPAEILYVGNDMRNDIWPASRAGWQTALFAGDRRSLRLREDDDRVAEVRPTYVIETIDQLTSIIGIVEP